MKSFFAVCGFALILICPAFADQRIFIVGNQPDGYGIDNCLAKGEKCGAHAARTFCKSRAFAEATSYSRVDPEDITGSVPASTGGACKSGNCQEYVAITCKR